METRKRRVDNQIGIVLSCEPVPDRMTTLMVHYLKRSSEALWQGFVCVFEYIMGKRAIAFGYKEAWRLYIFEDAHIHRR